MDMWYFFKMLFVNTACIAAIIGGYEIIVQFGMLALPTVVVLIAVVLTTVQTLIEWADRHENYSLPTR